MDKFIEVVVFPSVLKECSFELKNNEFVKIFGSIVEDSSTGKKKLMANKIEKAQPAN